MSQASRPITVHPTLKQAARRIAGMHGVRGRRNGRSDAIAQALRDQIASGKLQPGDPIPPRRELETLFNTGANTLQHALRQLNEEGFIQSAGTRRGTFVAEKLPFQNAYGLVVPYTIPARGGEPVLLFQRDLYFEAEAMQQEGEADFRTYQGVRHDYDQGQWREVVEAARRHLLAGLILTMPWKTHRPEIVAACQETGLPVTAIMAGPPPRGVTRVHPALERWIERAVERLAADGCRRIAALNLGQMRQPFEKALKRCGCESRPYWQHEVHPDIAHAAQPAMHLLMRDRPRPNGLIILEDGLVEPALAGLADAGARTPDDLRVVALCNYPYKPAAAMPVQWLGYQVRGMLRQCIGLIDQQRRGQQTPRDVIVSPRFEHELT